MIFELLKNSSRTTVEKHGDKAPSFPILADVVVSETDVIIRISDSGMLLPFLHHLRVVCVVKLCAHVDRRRYRAYDPSARTANSSTARHLLLPPLAIHLEQSRRSQETGQL